MKERGKKSSPSFSLSKKNSKIQSGAGVSVKTSTSIMGPYSNDVYDVGCRGDSYSPDGPCYGTLLAQQAWVTRVKTCSAEEQFLW